MTKILLALLLTSIPFAAMAKTYDLELSDGRTCRKCTYTMGEGGVVNSILDRNGEEFLQPGVQVQITEVKRHRAAGWKVLGYTMMGLGAAGSGYAKGYNSSKPTTVQMNCTKFDGTNTSNCTGTSY